jgi:hypothetical protein
VTIVVPFAAGSSTDTAARILAVGMSEVLGQQLVIENVGGAAGMTGTLRVARAAPDGHRLLFGRSTRWRSPALQAAPYDSIKDFTPAGGGRTAHHADRARKFAGQDAAVRDIRESQPGECSSAPLALAQARILPAPS